MLIKIIGVKLLVKGQGVYDPLKLKNANAHMCTLVLAKIVTNFRFLSPQDFCKISNASVANDSITRATNLFRNQLLGNKDNNGGGSSSGPQGA